MTPKQKLEALMKIASKKNNDFDAAFIKLNKLLDENSSALAKLIAKEVIGKLEVKDGVITTSSANLLKALSASATIDRFMAKVGQRIAKNLKDSVANIGKHNEQYFNSLNESSRQVSRANIDKIINARLGLTETGNIKKTGFMASIAAPSELKKVIVDYLSTKVGSSAGLNEMTKGLKELIVGKGEESGAFKKYYRNTVADTMAKVDALNADLYAAKLGLNYFIYAGTRREHSRYFCLQRKQKIFSRDEAKQWKDLIGTETEVDGKMVPAGPIVTKQDITTYDPFIDRGGYGCVDDINWISNEMAFALRPDLKKV